MMDVVKNFTGKHPKAAKWVWEGGLFVIFSYVVTFLRYIMFQFLPAMFSGYTDIGWGWPSVDVSIFGISFVWNAIGYSVEQGGLVPKPRETHAADYRLFFCMDVNYNYCKFY